MAKSSSKGSTARIASGGGSVTLEVIIGQRQFGIYDIWRMAPDGSGARKLLEGDSADTVEDKCDLGSPQDLVGQIAICRVAILRSTIGPGEFYDIMLIVRQGDTVVSGGTISERGRLNDEVAFVGRFDLEVL